MVVEPGEQAPLTVLRLVELANQVLPPGVLNAVTGLEAGRALASHPGLGRLTFTGSSETGRAVLASAAATLTPCNMELGGKNALLVFPDADLDLTVLSAREGMFFNQGEASTSTSRLLVNDEVYDAFVERFTAAAVRLPRGVRPEPKHRPRPDGRPSPAASGARPHPAGSQRRRTAGRPGRGPRGPRLACGFWFPQRCSPRST